MTYLLGSFIYACGVYAGWLIRDHQQFRQRLAEAMGDSED